MTFIKYHVWTHRTAVVDGEATITGNDDRGTLDIRNDATDENVKHLVALSLADTLGVDPAELNERIAEVHRHNGDIYLIDTNGAPFASLVPIIEESAEKRPTHGHSRLALWLFLFLAGMLAIAALM